MSKPARNGDISVRQNSDPVLSEIARQSHGEFKRKPNFLIIIVDEERYPPIYENEEIREWRKENLITQDLLSQNGMEFQRHYVGSTACSPSRGTLFTGQYPSLHGVTQTTGLAKGSFDPNAFWLNFGTVPTMGNYFRAAGYRTFYKGKWHISDQDILIPGTHNQFPSYNPITGVPIEEREEIYLRSQRLDHYGFSGWVGPEPHGTDPRNSGSSARIGLAGRDQVYAAEAASLIQNLDRKKEDHPDSAAEPWLIVSSFVNPHDIALFGALTRLNPLFEFDVDPSVPNVPPPPTLNESLKTKPRCQESYRETYPLAVQPLRNTSLYRRLYYQLQKNADQQMLKVFESLKNSSFYEDTIVLFTSDHGDLLGAHGGLHQKWYCAYEEALHVPLMIHNPILFNGRESTDMLTSHVDILPTLLGLADIDIEAVQNITRADHTEVHPFVGRDLSSVIFKETPPDSLEEPIYFMTDDDPTRGLNQVGPLGIPYESVIQPNHIETVVAALTTNGEKEIWKLSRYFDNPQFWSDPGVKDEVLHQVGSSDIEGSNEAVEVSECFTTIKTQPVPDELEMYNLTADPLETMNLANPQYSSEESRKIEKQLAALLDEQCRLKRLSPSSGTVPGMPTCEEI